MSAADKRARRDPAVESKQKLRLWLRLLRHTRTIEAELRERLRLNFDSTLPRFDVMAVLYRVGTNPEAKARKTAGMTMTALSRQLLVSNGNATVIVDRLVKDGFVIRVTHLKDRRSTVVSLTAAGTDLFRAMAAAHESWIADIMSNVTSHETEQLLQLLPPSAPPTSASTSGDL